jgi:hypothetical protein
MGIIILPPVVEDIVPHHDESDDSTSVDSDEDVEMSGVRAPKRARIGNQTVSTGVVTPGEVVTDDPQWMRLVAPKSCAEVPYSFSSLSRSFRAASLSPSI